MRFDSPNDRSIRGGGCLETTAAWAALEEHRESIGDLRMLELFDRDSGRFERCSIALDSFFFDYSKNLVTGETMELLVRLARDAGVAEAAKDMLSGRRINWTENRAVLHTALRNRSSSPVEVDGVDVMPAVNAVLDKMRRFSDEVRSGGWRGATGRPMLRSWMRLRAPRQARSRLPWPSPSARASTCTASMRREGGTNSVATSRCTGETASAARCMLPSGSSAKGS